MTRVFLDDSQISGDLATISGADAHHLLNVLRMAPGDSIIVVDERGRQHQATLTAVDEARALARLGALVEGSPEPLVRVELYHGLPRASRYETALRMCTELGVSAYVPVLSARSVVRLGREAGARKQGRWERVVEEAAKQCGRTQAPQVLAPLRWEEALERYTSVGVPGVMPSAGLAGSDARSLGDAAAELAARSRHGVALFIGPESGFDLAEEASAEAAGVTLVTMGPRILRTETAAVVASAILLDRLGEMQ